MPHRVHALLSWAILLALTCSLFFASQAFASFDEYINYQGKLHSVSTDDAVPDDDYNIEFKLYTASAGGVPIWTETRTGANVVTITDGLFSVQLGDVTSLDGIDFNQSLYLSVNIGGTSTPVWDGEMTPRKRLSTVPTALIAKTALALDSTNATTTNLIVTNATTTRLTVGTDSITDITGTGLVVTAGALSISTSTLTVATSTNSDDAELLDGIDSTSFLRSDTSDAFTSGTLTTNSGTTLDVNGDIQIADTQIGFDGASTNFNMTGNFSINGDDLYVGKTSGNVAIGGGSVAAKLAMFNGVSTSLHTDWLDGFVNVMYAAFSETNGQGHHMFATANNFDALARSVINARRSRGTVDTPLAVSSDDYLFSVTASGYDGDQFHDTASIDFIVDDTVANNTVPTRIAFLTGSNTSGKLERFTIMPNGNIGVSSTTPWANLAVNPIAGAASNQFVVGSSTRTSFIISNAGNVGIGTTTPGSIFSVQGVANFTAATSTFASTGGINLGAGCFAKNGTCVRESQWITTGSDIYYNSGRVAIGTTNHSATFTIGTTSNSGGTLVELQRFTYDADYYSSIRASTGGSTGQNQLQFSITKGGVTSNPLTLSDNHVTFNQGGNVGIGLSDPSDIFHVRNSATTNGITIDPGAVGGGTGGTLTFKNSGNGNWNSHIQVSNTNTGSVDGIFSFIQPVAHTDAQTVMTLRGRNVGVGSTTPWGLLSVNPNAITGPAFVVGSSTGTRFIVAENGNIGIGTTTPSNSAALVVASSTSATVQIDASSVGNASVNFSEAGASRWSLSVNNTNDAIYVVDADISAGVTMNQNATSWSAFSDARLKENVATLSVLDRLSGFRAVSFDWKKSQTHDLGVIAQELHAVFPEIVHQGSDDLNEEPELMSGNAWTVQYDKIAPLALQGVKEVSTILGLGNASSTRQAMMVSSAGNIGIGVSTADHLLTLSGGAYSDGTSWENASSRDLKENFVGLDRNEILAKIERLTIQEWNYKTQGGSVKHIGPIAEEFYDLFRLGGSNKSISSIDPAGVALLGVQALSAKVKSLEMLIVELQTASSTDSIADEAPLGVLADSRNLLDHASDVIAEVMDSFSEKVASGINNVRGQIVAFQGTFRNVFTSTLALLPDGFIEVAYGRNQMTGSGVMHTGQRSVDIPNTSVRVTSNIIVTPTTLIKNPLVVTRKTDGVGFTVETFEPVSQTVRFDWVIIQTYPLSGEGEEMEMPLPIEETAVSIPGETVIGGEGATTTTATTTAATSTEPIEPEDLPEVPVEEVVEPEPEPEVEEEVVAPEPEVVSSPAEEEVPVVVEVTENEVVSE